MRRTLTWLVLGAALTPGPLEAQVRWTKAAANPVLVRAASFFEALAIGQPAVLEEGGVLRLWYAAGGLDQRGRILAARSSDGGLTWQREAGGWPVLDVGPAGSWDAHFLDTPEVIREGGLYRLYYYGSTSNDSVGAAIGLATSPDGLQFRRVGTEPVLRPGPPGSWDELWVESPAVLRDPVDGTWLMWYTGIDATWRVRIGLATSRDGVTWVKHPENPVLDFGPPGSWDSGDVGVPGVIPWRNGYLMVYSGISLEDLVGGTFGENIGAGLAFSLDGVSWTRLGVNPVLTTTSPPHDPAVDDRGPWAPDLVPDPSGHRLLMLYETAAGFCLAASPVEATRRPRFRVPPGVPRAFPGADPP